MPHRVSIFGLSAISASADVWARGSGKGTTQRRSGSRRLGAGRCAPLAPRLLPPGAAARRKNAKLNKGTQSRCCGAHVTLFASEKVKTEKLERSSHGPARPVHARYRNPEADTPPYRTHESERETETERECERQATRGRATRPGQPGAPVTRRAAARDTVLRIPRA